MELLKGIMSEKLNKNIIIKMTIADFLSMYIAKMTCNPSEFFSCQTEVFPDIKEDLFVESVGTEEMEEIIDEIEFPHEEWL